jgi:hypothetical protein
MEQIMTLRDLIIPQDQYINNYWPAEERNQLMPLY